MKCLGRLWRDSLLERQFSRTWHFAKGDDAKISEYAVSHEREHTNYQNIYFFKYNFHIILYRNSKKKQEMQNTFPVL